jgi:NitT/TauT family transport system substrate-binding protein
MTPSRHSLTVLLSLLLVVVALSTAVLAQDTAPEETELIPVRIGAIEGASQTYIPRLIDQLGIDTKYGLDFILTPLTATGQQWTGLRSNEFDITTGSFLDLLRQREAGLEARAVRSFLRFSNPIVTLPDAPYDSLESLSGTVVGTPNTTLLDWLIIRAAGVEISGFDLEQEANVVNASPPLISELLRTGELDAALQFTSNTYGPVAAGEQRIITSVPVLLEEAGFDPDAFYLTYNLADRFAEEHPEAVPAIIAAINEAIEVLQTDDSVWPELAALSGIEDEDILAAYIVSERQAFNTVFSEEKLESTQALVDSLVALVGEEVVGVTVVDPEAFDFASYEAALALAGE